MGVTVGLLGGVRVTFDGVPVDVGGRRPSLVLASLALADQRVLSAERLIDLVWGDDPPVTARRTLQSYVSVLRRSFGGERAPLSSSGAGYVLSIGRTDVDVFVFADAVARAKVAMDADSTAAGRGLSAALASWAAPLDGLRPTAALEAVVAPYEALRLEALEVLNDVDLASDVARAVARLEMLVREHPTRERFWAQLVRGLAVLGRRDAALHAGQRAREALRENLGVGPSRLLLDLERDVLNDGTETHHVTAPSESPEGSPREQIVGEPAVSVRALLGVDIAGSAELASVLAHDVAVTERYRSIVAEAVGPHAGVVRRDDGAQLLVTFPSVRAALEGALDAQRRFEREVWPVEGRLRVRMGVHVGEVADSGVGLVGVAIHQTLKIAGAAHDGQLLVSGDAVRQAGRLPLSATTSPMGEYDLRDLPPVAVHQLHHPDLDDRFPKLRLGRARPNNLPAALTSLVGRETDTATVLTLLGEHRLVTLLGQGGCGKTRLALSVGNSSLDRFVDGAWFVDLAPLPAGAEVSSRIAQVLGLAGDVDDLVAALKQRSALIILDNCEHVAEATANVVADVLPRCPMTTVLATSRSPLEVGGEMCFPVPPLSLPRRGADLRAVEASSAVELFISRASLVRPGYRLGERDIESVVELCTRLDGLPLAIELAAARLRTMSVAELVARLDDRFGVLAGGPRSAPARHRSLRDTIEWSIRLLDDAEQHLLRHLAVFRGGCDLESAEAVCAADMPAAVRPADAVDQLVRKSLLSPREADDATRYRLHETIREHVIASTTPGDLDAAHERHAHWFAQLASRLSAGPVPGGEEAWIRRHVDDRDNFAAAARWLITRDPPTALRLLIDIDPGTDQTSDPAWHKELLREALESADGAAAGDRAAALALLAWSDSETTLPSALDELNHAVELLATVDDSVVECNVLLAVAKCHADFAGGALDRDEVAAAVAAGDRAGGTYWPVMTRELLSYKAPPAIGDSLLAEALLIAEQMHLDYFAAGLRGRLACNAQFRSDSAEVIAAWRLIASGVDGTAVLRLESACFYALAQGEHADVAAGLHAAEHLLLRLPAAPLDPAVAAMQSVIAHLRRLAGDLAGSHAALEAASRAGPAPWDFLGGLSIITRSALWRLRGEPRRAAATIELAWHHIGYRGSTDIPMRVLEELAAVAIDLGQLQHGADLLATARLVRQDEHKPLSPACRIEVDRLSTQVGTRRGIPLETPQAVQLAHSLASAHQA